MSRLLRLFWPVLLFGVLIGAVIGALVFAFAPWWVALIAGAAVGAGAAWWRLSSAEARLLGVLGAAELSVADQPRVHNITDGLSLTMGFPSVAVFGVRDSAVNAAALGDHKRPVLILTSGAVDSLGVLELEALVSRQLVRCRTDVPRRMTIGHSFLSSFGLTAMAANYIAAPSSIDDDLEAVSSTRYPPGLQAALELCTAITGPRGLVGLWTVSTPDTAPRHDAPAQRIAVLREL